MKKTILLFFVLTTLLFSSNNFITSNGEISFKYNKTQNKLVNVNGDLTQEEKRIDGIEVGVYYKGVYYPFSDYIVKSNFIPKTNILETTAKLPFGTIKTTYIPSMIDKDALYIGNNYDFNKKENSLEFIYLFDIVKENGIVKSNKDKGYYSYNNDFYVKNLKNQMTGYIVPSVGLDEVKLTSIKTESIKYKNQKIIFSSEMKRNTKEKSDLIEIRYNKNFPENTIKNLDKIKDIEVKNWEKWLKPISINGIDKEIVERFLIYLKTSTDGKNYYTNIGLREKISSEAKIQTAITFLKYGYESDAKKILQNLIDKESEMSYLKNDEITIQEIKETSSYLGYILATDDIDFYNKNINIIIKKVRRIVGVMNKKRKEITPIEKGYEFEIFYNIEKLLDLYKKVTLSNEYQGEKQSIRNLIKDVFLTTDGIKKYSLDKGIYYSKWEFLSLYQNETHERLLEELYDSTIFNRHPYFSKSKEIEVSKELKVLKEFYENDLKRYGDINLYQINEDIRKNNMKIPNKIYLTEKNKYTTNGIDIYLTAKYLDAIFSRSVK